MAHSVRSHLRLEISAYDNAIRRFIPGYDAMIGEAAGCVAAMLPQHVVDLGAGTGALSAALLERGGVGRVELVDVDPEMLGAARRRLADFGERAVYTQRSFEGPLPACDAIVASLSLHHIPTLDAKKSIFAEAFAAIRPGGVFVNADANMPENARERDALYRMWADHMVYNGIAEDQAWRHFEQWAQEDTYLPLDAEWAALEEVGFELRRAWSLGPISVVVARRPWDGAESFGAEA